MFCSPASRGWTRENNRLIKARRRARRADMEKNIAAESAARLSTAQALKAKNIAVRSTARLSAVQVLKTKHMAAGSATAACPAAAAASAAAAAGEAGSVSTFLERELAGVAMGRVCGTPPPPKIDEAPTFELFARQTSFLATRLATKINTSTHVTIRNARRRTIQLSTRVRS